MLRRSAGVGANSARGCGISGRFRFKDKTAGRIFEEEPAQNLLGLSSAIHFLFAAYGKIDCIAKVFGQIACISLTQSRGNLTRNVAEVQTETDNKCKKYLHEKRVARCKNNAIMCF